MNAEMKPMPAGQPQPRDAQAQAGARHNGATIGAKTRIEGELNAEEDLLIEGSFDGTLLLRKNVLAIGARGAITGTAYANTVVVEGAVEGDLYAAERISIRKGAKVQGNIHSPRVSLEDGATLRGTVEMDPEAIAEAIKSKFGDVLKVAGENRPEATAPRPGNSPTAPATVAPAKDGPKPDPNKPADSRPDVARSPAQGATATASAK